MKRIARLMNALAALAVLSTAAHAAAPPATQPPTQPADVVLATVNGEPLTSKEVVAEFSKRHSGHAKFLGGDAEARQFMNALIDQRLFIQEAYDIGLDRDPAVVALVDEFVETKTTALLVRREIEAKSKVSPDDVRDTWQKKLNVILQVRQIAVDTKEEAEEVRAAILQGADFETLARDCSRAPSRSSGGHLRLNWGQADPAWEEVVFGLGPGEVSPVLPTPGGYEVVIVDDRIDTAHPEFEKFSSQIEAVLAQRRLDERKRAFSAELWQKYHVTLPETGLTVARIASLLATAPETVIATWDGGGKLTAAQTFSLDDLHQWAMFSPRTSGLLIEERVRATVNSPLTAAEAKARHLADDPELKDVIASYLETAMQKVLFAEHIYKEVSVSETDAKAYYDTHPAEFVEPEQRHVAHVLSSSEAEALAVRKRLEAGADFVETVKKSSKDYESALMEGSLGWVTVEKVPPAFREVWTLSAGQLSKPIQSKQGWHIVKVLEIKPKQQEPFAEVTAKAMKKATAAKHEAEQEFWLKKLRAASKIVFDDAAIRSFVAANEFDGNASPLKHGIQ